MIVAQFRSGERWIYLVRRKPTPSPPLPASFNRSIGFSGGNPLSSPSPRRAPEKGDGRSRRMAGPNPERSPVETCDEDKNGFHRTLPYVKAISGSLGGTVEACCLQPINVIKTRLQLDKNGTYKGIIHCGGTIVRTEGVRPLWNGLAPFSTHLTLKYTLHMGSNGVFQTAFKDPETGKLSNAGGGCCPVSVLGSWRRSSSSPLLRW